MNEAWYYTRDGQQVGPVTLDELRHLTSIGQLRPEEMVWRDGMANWVAVAQAPELAAALGQPGGGAQVPLSYGTPHASAPYPAAAYPAGVLPYRTPDFQVHYAGFWIRFVAAFVDGLIMSIPNFILSAMAESSRDPSVPPDVRMALLMNGVSIVFGWLYEALFTASSYQATPGKMLVGIRVTDVNGNQISFARATGRHFAKFISAIILLIGYIMAAFDKQKRALHDVMAGTLVTYKSR